MGTWSYFRRLGTSIFWFCNISKFCDYPTLRSTIPDLPGGQGSATRCHLGQPHQKVSSLHRKVTAGPEIGQTRTFLIKDRLYAFKSVKTPKSMQKYTTWQPHAVKMYYKTSSYKETKTTEAKSSNLSTTNTKNCIFKVVGQQKKQRDFLVQVFFSREARNSINHTIGQDDPHPIIIDHFIDCC